MEELICPSFVVDSKLSSTVINLKDTGFTGSQLDTLKQHKRQSVILHLLATCSGQDGWVCFCCCLFTDDEGSLWSLCGEVLALFPPVCFVCLPWSPCCPCPRRWRWPACLAVSPPQTSPARTLTTITPCGTSAFWKATGSNSTSPTSAWSLQRTANMTTSRYAKLTITSTQEPTVLFLYFVVYPLYFNSAWRLCCDQTRCWPRQTRLCVSVATERKDMRTLLGTRLSCRPGTLCLWSSGVTTLTRAVSQAFTHFTPPKVMWALDTFAAVIPIQQHAEKKLLVKFVNIVIVRS